MAAETLPELEPSERLAVMNWVGLPPVQSCTSLLSCCVQDALTIIGLGDVQLTLHCTEPVVGLKSQEAMKTMKPPTTKKELQKLIGKINFVR